MIISYRVLVYIVITLCLLTICSLFSIKDSVVTLKSELQEVRKQVQNEEDAIRILKAELAYLSSPERIQKLASKYLTLEKPKVTQMIKDPLITENLETSQTLANSKSNKGNTKWHYKKGPTKYLTMVKGRK
ncbi:MAG: cell division protein FtsL [Rickettsiaceae bacterium]